MLFSFSLHNDDMDNRNDEIDYDVNIILFLFADSFVTVVCLISVPCGRSHCLSRARVQQMTSQWEHLQVEQEVIRDRVTQA